MNNTITKSVPVSVKPRGGKTQTIDTAPPWAALSFVTYTVKRGRYEVTDWLGVPLQTFGDSCITGLRVVDELAAWAKLHPIHAGDAVTGVLMAAKAIHDASIGQRSTPRSLGKAGAALKVWHSMLELLTSAVRNFDVAAYCNREIESQRLTNEFYAQREAVRLRGFVQRMQAARASKSASKKFTGLASFQKTSNTSNKK